jgi:hypothetical protein
LVHRFKLPINHLAGEPVYRDAHPLALLAFLDKVSKRLYLARRMRSASDAAIA